jgi:SAM-dependent methyltransferase
VGKFIWGGTTLRVDARCPQCRSLERHRLLARAIDQGFVDFAGADVLHFAPEPIVAKLVDKQRPKSRVTGDISPGRAELVLNIEKLDLPDEGFDRIICSHVLEHVDDGKALSEMRRVLRPGGQVIIMVPIIEGWSGSYEDPAIADPRGREQHFGQDDHIRYYGSDLRDRIREAGFALSEYTADGVNSVRYRLSRGEKVFLATRA